MARLSKSALLDRVIQSFEEGGRSVLVEDAAKPFLLRVQDGSEFLRYRIYIWNITHGGGQARASDEYRIQVTGPASFDTTGVARTLVLGWWEEGSVFAAWDVSKHTGALGSSPSFQILEGTLTDAATNRVATQTKGNDEIAIAFVPQFLGDYAILQPGLHSLGASAADLKALSGVVANPSDAGSAISKGSTVPRRTVLAEVARKLRDRTFGDRVLRAYGHACAMCGVQLRLLEAAHIVPVADANNDNTSNGVALCTLHHRAFDRALVSMDEKFRVVVNPERIARLTSDNQLGGFPAFRKQLKAIIDLPPAKGDRPDPDLIREGNRIRGWVRFQRVA